MSTWKIVSIAAGSVAGAAASFFAGFYAGKKSERSKQLRDQPTTNVRRQPINREEHGTRAQA